MKINKQKLQIAMSNSCMNLTDLSEKAEISRTSLCLYCSGSREPRPKTLGKIAKALCVSAEDLIEKGGDPVD